MNYLLNTGNVVRLSLYSQLASTDDAAFSLALAASKDAAGYSKRIIVNDLGRPLILTGRYVFQSVAQTSVLGDKYNENLCGVVGEYELISGGGFDFISCYSPYINIVITDGGENTIDIGTYSNSDFAVRMESGVINPEFHIVGYEYSGYLFGTCGVWGGVRAAGVQSVHKSSVAAFGGGAAIYIYISQAQPDSVISLQCGKRE